MGLGPPGDPGPLDPSTGQPWVNPQPGAFPGTDNNKYTGASRQIGEFGGFPVGQVDVRTDMMKQLEAGVLPLLLQILQDPSAVGQKLGGAAGAVPRTGTSTLGSFLFGGAGNGIPSGPGGGPGMPPGGGGQPPAGGGASPVAPPPAQPWQDMPGVTPPQGGSGTLFGNVNIDALNQILSAGGYGGQVMNAADIQRSQLGPAYADDEYWNGFKQNYDGFGYFTNTGPGGALNPAYQFGNPQQLMGYFTDPSKFAQPHADYTKKDTSGGKISPGEWQAWVDAFQKQGGQALAGGGILDPMKPALVGEQGPEMILPGAPGGQQVVSLAGQPGIGQFTGPKANMTLAGSPPSQQANVVAPPQNPLGTPTTPAGPGTGNFPTSPVQGQGTGMIQQLLQQNPEMQAFQQAQQSLLGAGGALGAGGGGQGVVNALQPLFQQNLKFGLNELTNRMPSTFNSAGAIEGADLTSRAMNDFNLMAAQALQQGQQTGIQGLGMLGQLAGQAGNGAFNRALGAGQLDTQRSLGFGNLDLAAQQQQWNQTVNPTLQLLLAAMGMATPTAYQTVVPGKK